MRNKLLKLTILLSLCLCHSFVSARDRETDTLVIHRSYDLIEECKYNKYTNERTHFYYLLSEYGDAKMFIKHNHLYSAWDANQRFTLRMKEYGRTLVDSVVSSVLSDEEISSIRKGALEVRFYLFTIRRGVHLAGIFIYGDSLNDRIPKEKIRKMLSCFKEKEDELPLLPVDCWYTSHNNYGEWVVPYPDPKKKNEVVDDKKKKGEIYIR